MNSSAETSIILYDYPIFHSTRSHSSNIGYNNNNDNNNNTNNNISSNNNNNIIIVIFIYLFTCAYASINLVKHECVCAAVQGMAFSPFGQEQDK